MDEAYNLGPISSLFHNNNFGQGRGMQSQSVLLSLVEIQLIRPRSFFGRSCRAADGILKFPTLSMVLIVYNLIDNIVERIILLYFFFLNFVTVQ